MKERHDEIAVETTLDAVTECTLLPAGAGGATVSRLLANAEGNVSSDRKYPEVRKSKCA